MTNIIYLDSINGGLKDGKLFMDPFHSLGWSTCVLASLFQLPLGSHDFFQMLCNAVQIHKLFSLKIIIYIYIENVNLLIFTQ